MPCRGCTQRSEGQTLPLDRGYLYCLDRLLLAKSDMLISLIYIEVQRLKLSFWLLERVRTAIRTTKSNLPALENAL